MERKIAIIKNGYDILRIREINSDEEKCEFKICIMAEQKNVKILYNKLFSEKKLNLTKMNIMKLHIIKLQ